MDAYEILNEDDIVSARSAARSLAGELGFSVIDMTRIATAVSELARNALTHGGGGRMEIANASANGKSGLRCTFVDHGPGIPDIDKAMSDGFSTGSSLGHGLPGAKRLVDEFEIESQFGKGTRVEIIKWI